MTSTDYKKVLAQAFDRILALSSKRLEIDAEIARHYEFMMATVNMLPEADQKEFWNRFRKDHMALVAKTESLTDAVREVLCENNMRWLTCTDVRDALRERGFDFSSYRTNPLASISTTLKRLDPQDAKTTTAGGVTVYRFRGTKAAWHRIQQRKERRIISGLFGENKADEVMERINQPRDVSPESDAFANRDDEKNEEK